LNGPGKTFQNRSGVLKPIVVFSQQHAMAAVSIAVQPAEVWYDPRPQGIQMNVTHQLEQAGLFLT
jgi:hypothetical protein